MFNYCSHGTLLHFGLQGSHLNICYYYQDLLPWQLHSASRLKLLRYHGGPPTRHGLLNNPARPVKAEHNCNSAVPVRYRSIAKAPSIFRAGWFGRWVVTHSLADSNFHGHRPAVYTNQHLFWYLMSDCVWHLNRTFGSSHSASSAYQKWPTRHSHSMTKSN